MRLQWIRASWLALVVAASACSQSGGAATNAGPLSALSVSTGSLVPAFDPGTTDYSMTSLNALHPISVTATASDPSAVVTIQGAAAQSGAPSTLTLQPAEDISVVVQPAPGGAPQTYTVHYVPSDLPPYEVQSAPGAGTEDVLMTPGNNYALVVDRSGAPLYYRTFAPQQVGDFKRHVLPDGTVGYSAQVGTFDTRGWQLGVEHLMDEDFGDLGDVALLPNREHDALPAEQHDFLLLDQNHYVAMSYVQRVVDLSGLNPTWSDQAPVMNAIVQEVDGGSVAFEWDSADVSSLYTDSVDGNAFTSGGVSDYLHLNSIDIDPADGNFIFSLRHTNSIVKVDRNTEEIVWTLGGAEDQFGLSPDQVFSHQHYVRVQPDGSLMLLDNGNNMHPTRIISFVLDEQAKKVTSFQVIYTKPPAFPQSLFAGSTVQLDTGRYFFGWGGWTSGAIAPAATEVVDGAQVWSLTLTKPNVFSYRALPVPSL